jgi:hypothetical protein
MSTLEINVNVKAPELVNVLQQLFSVLAPKAITPNTAKSDPMPQTFEQMAIQQSIVQTPPAQQAPTYIPPVTPPTPQPQYQAAPPQQYPPQQYQAAPVNPTPAAPAYPNQMMGAVNTAPAATAAPTGNAPTASPSNQAPVAAAPTYVIEDLARGAAQLMDAGRGQECTNLLAQFRVNGLSELKPEQFGAFATALRQMGARI